MRARHRFLAHCALALAILLLMLLSLWIPEINNPLFLREELLQAGPFGYIILTILIALSIPLPIPSNIVALSGGYVYGIIAGTTLSLIGTILGGTISFLLVRKLGRSFLEKVVSHHHVVHFNHLLKKRGQSAILLSLAIPIFPADAIYFLLGLSTVRYHAFLILIILGNIPRYLLINGLGSDLYTRFTSRTAILLIIATLFTLIALFRECIKKIVFTELRELEDEVELVETEVGIKNKSKR